MQRLLRIFLPALAALLAAAPVWADSTVGGLGNTTTSPIPALSCLYVDQGPGVDTKLCAGSPLGDTLAHAFASLSSADNLSDVQNAATARANLGLATVAASGLASDLTGILPAGSLPTSGVTAGSCTNCNLTIDATGRVTVQGNGSGGLSGPGTTTNLFVPQWNGTNGTALGAGLAIGTGANNLVETNGSSVIAASVLPLPTASTLGGVESLAPVSHNFMTGIGTNGVGSLAQPACADLSDSQTGCSTIVGSIATQSASNVSITGGSIAVTADPTTALQVATKEYVDSTAAQISRLSPVQAATTTALPNSPVYSNGSSGVGATLTAGSNGALTIDGYTVLLNDRVLIQNQATAANNGLYSQTQLGDGTHPYILTRSTDFDQATEIITGATVYARNGSANVNGQFTMNSPQPITVGTTAINWVQTGAGGTITGPGSATVGFVPQWSNTSGSALSAGLAVATTGANTIAETNGSGLLANGIIPSPGTAPALGGVQAFTAATHKAITAINTDGSETATQFGFGDLSGSIAASQMLGLPNGDVYQGNGSSQPAAVSLSAAIDAAIGSTRGSLLERGASGWALLTPGTAGFGLLSNGAGADPSWQALTVCSICIVNTQTTNYTLVGTDAGTIIQDSGQAITFTLPSNASGAVFAPGKQFILQNTGSDIDMLQTSGGTVFNGVPTALSGAEIFLPGNGGAAMITVDSGDNYSVQYLPAPVGAESTASTSFTLSVGSCGVTYNVTANITITIPTGLPPGCHVEFDANGGIPTLAAGSGFTLTSPHGFTKASANGASIGVAILSSTGGVFQGDGA